MDRPLRFGCLDFQVLRLDWVPAGRCQTMSSVAAIPIASLWNTPETATSASTWVGGGGGACQRAGRPATPTGTLVVDVLVTVRPLETKGSDVLVPTGSLTRL